MMLTEAPPNEEKTEEWKDVYSSEEDAKMTLINEAPKVPCMSPPKWRGSDSFDYFIWVKG